MTESNVYKETEIPTMRMVEIEYLERAGAKIATLADTNAELLEALDDLVEAVDYVPYDEFSEQTKPHLIERAAIRARKAIEKATA